MENIKGSPFPVIFLSWLETPLDDKLYRLDI